jgi:hypothetical protein
MLITQAAAFQHNPTPGDNQGATLSRNQSIWRNSIMWHIFGSADPQSPALLNEIVPGKQQGRQRVTRLGRGKGGAWSSQLDKKDLNWQKHQHCSWVCRCLAPISSFLSSPGYWCIVVLQAYISQASWTILHGV